MLLSKRRELLFQRRGGFLKKTFLLIKNLRVFWENPRGLLRNPWGLLYKTRVLW
jgi:hypothetical protein